MKDLLRVIVFVSISLFPAFASPQGIDLSHFQIQKEYARPQNGISSLSVRDIIQDEGGLLWIATPDGLDISDGLNFSRFPADGTGMQLGLTGVNCLVSCGDHVLAGTEQGILAIDILTHEYSYISNEGPVRSLACRDGVVLAATADAVLGYELIGGNWQPRTGDSLAVKGCQQILRMGENWFLAGNSGLWKYDGRKLQRMRIAGIPDTLWCLAAARGGNLWGGNAQGLVFIDMVNGSTRTLIPSENGFSQQADKILSLVSIGDELLWAGTSGSGILQVNMDDSIGMLSGLSELFVYDLCQTRDGSVWAGTAWNGLFRIEIPDKSFTSFDTESSVWDFIHRPAMDDWVIAGGSGLAFMKRDEESGVMKNTGYFDADEGFRTLLLTDDEELLAAGSGPGIRKISGDTGIFLELSPPVIRSGEMIVQDLVRGNDGRYWAATSLGLCRFNPDGSKQDWYFYPDDTLSTNFYCAVAAGDKVLFGSHEGLFELDQATGKFKVWKRIPRKQGSMTLNKVISLLVTEDGTRWIGTLGGGLNFQRQGEEGFSYLTVSDGLPDNVITSLSAGEDGEVWIGTNKGLCRYDPATGEIISYSTLNGLPGAELNIGASYMDSEGRLWVGGRKGFAVSDREQVRLRSGGPELCISSLWISGRNMLYSINEAQSFILEPGQNSISFNFASLSFNNPFQNRFRYILEGYDKDWTLTGSDRTIAEYRKLPPGDYRFIIHGADHQGFWTKEPLVLTFHIKPPWYQRWWFRVLAILLPFLTVAFFWRNRLRTLRRKHELAMKMLDMEKQALRLQMNPHFIFNSLNSIQGFILQEKTEQAVHYLAKFAHLMRLILNNSREAFVSLSDELMAIRHYLDIEKLRFEGAFVYEIEVDENIETEFVGIPPMLIQPYVENAIIHGLLPLGGEGRLTVMVSGGADSLRITVEDNGIGREAAAIRKAGSGLQHQSKGMLITHERLELLNRQYSAQARVSVEDLSNAEGKPAGTRVIIETITMEL